MVPLTTGSGPHGTGYPGDVMLKILSLGASFLSWVMGFFGSSTRKDEIALGRAQQQVETHKADLAAIDRANKAAQSVQEKGVADDENNLDRGL